MFTPQFSFIVPVYNRPEEINELLESLSLQSYTEPFEVVIVEDGSTNTAEQVCEAYSNTLNMAYFYKKNTGPGDSRNYGMQRANGNYFIILDSDCIVPPNYLDAVAEELARDYVDCFGGPDAAHDSFTTIQKAINYAMTSFLTTGGIRGGKRAVGKFQPRSFNMGISQIAFQNTGGFGNIHPGEDPDLTFRIWEQGYHTRLFPKAYVYHKRRIDWGKFYTQVRKFGAVRPILSHWHPHTRKLTYWFPTIFIMGLVAGLGLLFFGFPWLCYLYLFYFVVLLVDAILKNTNVVVALLAVFAVGIQFFGYGIGFLKSTMMLIFSRKSPEQLFPKLFFTNT